MSVRIVVTGTNGQIARALQDVRASGLDIVAVARPNLDLGEPNTVLPALVATRADVIVNAAAYTSVDKAESERAAAFAINENGARAVAEAAAQLGIPLIQLSTDYVFAGTKSAPYVETDPTAPQNHYGASKLAGELAIALAQPNHAILRLGWVYGPHGGNFARAILRLAETRDEIAVVADQRGGPTLAADIANAIITVGRNLVAHDDAHLRGIFHLAPDGDASWAEFAEAIFANSLARGGPSARVRPIPSSDYPTLAERPANSRLDAGKLAAAHGVRLPHWRTSLAACFDVLQRSAR